jgi:drug/metabolite transporter (DMT)-like permease
MKKKPYLYISLTVLLWGSTAAVAKLLLGNLNPLQLLFYFSLIATISLFVIVLFQNKIDIIKGYTLKDYFYFAYMGFIGIFLYHILIFTGFSLAPVQEVFIVNYTWPIWIVIFSVIILKKRINIKKALAIILGFIGVFIVIVKGDFLNFSFVNIEGDLFALTGAISYGIFSVIGSKNHRDVLTSIMFFYGFSFIYVFIATIMFSNIPMVSINDLTGLIWMGTFAGGLAFVFWFLALRHGDTIEMSNIVFLTPFISLIYIYFLIGENILLYTIVGLFIIIISIYLNNKFS